MKEELGMCLRSLQIELLASGSRSHAPNSQPNEASSDGKARLKSQSIMAASAMGERKPKTFLLT